MEIHRDKIVIQQFPTFEINYVISARLAPCLATSITARVSNQGQCSCSLTLAGGLQIRKFGGCTKVA